jgi:hypothetical protein
MSYFVSPPSSVQVDADPPRNVNRAEIKKTLDAFRKLRSKLDKTSDGNVVYVIGSSGLMLPTQYACALPGMDVVDRDFREATANKHAVDTQIAQLEKALQKAL